MRRRANDKAEYMDTRGPGGPPGNQMRSAVTNGPIISLGETVEVVDKDAYDDAVKTLREIARAWCKHSDIKLNSNLALDRDWCDQCNNWIYSNDINPAKECLERLGEME